MKEKYIIFCTGEGEVYSVKVCLHESFSKNLSGPNYKVNISLHNTEVKKRGVLFDFLSY